MIKAVLLDLDNTLITNPHNRIDQTHQPWDDFFQAKTGRADAGQGLYAALHAVSTNLNPIAQNMDVFLHAISNAWDMTANDILALFEAFDREAYDSIAAQISPRPAAAPLLSWLRESGYQVVLATNPLFTSEALRRRLRWTGLDDDFSIYALVTHIENMHFTKPNPHYYEEVLGRLGIANDEAIMVGDDWAMDIVPAYQAGLNTYWIREDGTSPGTSDVTPDGEGTLNDFALRVCNLGWLDTLQPRPISPEMIVPRLLGNVAALFSILAEYAPDYWQQHPDPAEWSPLEVVCHLRDVESTTQRPRVERIAAEDNPFLTVPQEPPGPGQIACEAEYFCDPAEEFAAERMKTVAFLESLPPEAWQRPARHSIFGPTTLLEMANFTATHDRMHIKQICQTIGKCR